MMPETYQRALDQRAGGGPPQQEPQNPSLQAILRQLRENLGEMVDPPMFNPDAQLDTSRMNDIPPGLPQPPDFPMGLPKIPDPGLSPWPPIPGTEFQPEQQWPPMPGTDFQQEGPPPDLIAALLAMLQGQQNGVNPG